MKTPGPHDPTPSLDEFLAAYDEDDNWWWYLESGHHQNLFDEAVERMRAAEADLREAQAARHAEAWHRGTKP